jgi:hypothetical protein
MKHLYWLLLMLPFGCNGIYNFNTDIYKRKVVVESLIHPDSVVKVEVSWSRATLTTTTSTPILPTLIRSMPP